MNDLDQLAESIKYASQFVWHIAEPRPGLFILYDHSRKPRLISEDWNEVLEVYRARQPYVPPSAAPARKLDLEFNI
jgi:hypothetical protein